MSFKAVLFDLDGVITDTAEYHYLAWKELAESIGITIDRQFNEQLKGVSRISSLKRILAYGGKENAYSQAEIEKLATQKNNVYVQMISNIGPEDIYPGILELLKDLRAAGKKIALASASINAPLLLKKMQIAQYFDCIANAREANSKPHPAIFKLAAAGVRLDPSECIGIEDAPAGIEAIKAAGAVPIGVGRAEDLGDDIALVSSTSELTLAYLEQVWKKARS
ncbi:beta-phosphoglucomutase [Psittacicella hinzii]|uniref:Beta-phosphoglucomutase n=1 Tax=Psittacicella hinzii TaxID=2028575 RepID=A0A3A1YK75_9GAMM|nr:beta-phosphoglucomutase [Psittacicella hinzii]RIY38592.1 beta-phosphoglucomutase [Psittacicella hinzii]